MFYITKLVYYLLLMFYHTHLLSVTVNAQVNNFDSLLEARSSLRWNKRLYNALIRDMIGVSPLECVQECLRTTRCKSINYRANLQVCELNYKSEQVLNVSTTATEAAQEITITEARNFIYGDIKYWKKDMFVSFCNNKSCSINERCRENGEIGWCEISDCGVNLPYVNSTSVIDGNGIGIYYHRTYSCDGSKYISRTIVCQRDGNWSGIELNCNKEICQNAGFQFREDVSLCLKVHGELRNWTEARKICQGENADLIIVNTLAIYDVIKTLNLNTLSWVGATDMEIEGTWRWVDGSSLSTSPVLFKLDDDANSYTVGADCLMMNTYFKLHDTKCGKNLGFICQRKFDQTNLK